MSLRPHILPRRSRNAGIYVRPFLKDRYCQDTDRAINEGKQDRSVDLIFMSNDILLNRESAKIPAEKKPGDRNKKRKEVKRIKKSELKGQP